MTHLFLGRDACIESDVAHAMLCVCNMRQNLPGRYLPLAEREALLRRRYDLEVLPV